MHDLAAEQRTTCRFPWIWFTVLAALFIANFYQGLWWWSRVLWASRAFSDYSYYLFIAITISVGIVYIRLHKQALHYRPGGAFTPAVALVLAGLMIYSLGVGHWLYEYAGHRIRLSGLILCLFALPVTIAGWRWMRAGWFPIACLALILVHLPRIVTEPVIDLIRDLTYGVMVFFFGALNLVAETGVRVDGAELFVRGYSQHWIPLNITVAAIDLNLAAICIALGLGVAFIGFRWWCQRLMVVLAILPVWFVLNSVSWTVFVMFCANASPKIFSGLPFFLAKIFGTLLLMVLACSVLVFWGWVWKYAVVNDADTQVATPEPEAQVSAETPPARLSPSQILAGILVGGLSVVMIVGLTGYLLGAAAEVLSRGQHLVVVLVVTLVLPLAAQFLLRHRPWVRLSNPALIWPTMIGGFAAFFLGATLHHIQLVSHQVSRTPAALVQPLSSLPQQVGPWTMSYEGPRLGADIEIELGATEYLIRDYRNTDTGHEVRFALMFYNARPYVKWYDPEAAFGTGGLHLLDKNRAAILELEGEWQPDTTRGNTSPGGDPLKPWTTLLTNSDTPVRLHSKHLKISAFTFENPYGRGAKQIQFATFFITSDAYLPNYKELSWAMQTRRNREAGFVFKVELSTDHAHDREEALQFVTSFLSDMLPHIMACVPD